MIDILESVRQTLILESKAVASIPIDETITRAVEKILKCEGKLVFSGMGKAGLVARKTAATFASTGTPAIFLHPGEAQHGDLGVLAPNDILIAYSNSGKTRELLETVRLARGLHKISVIAITSDPDSPLAAAADVALLLGEITEACPFGLTPTASTAALAALGDALAIAVMQCKDFTPEDYARRHHGGYLGQKVRGEV